MVDEMPKNLVLYEQVNANPQLRRAYAGQFVAVVDGIIVDQDEGTFFELLYKRVSKNYKGRQVLYADFTNEKPLERRVLDPAVSN